MAQTGNHCVTSTYMHFFLSFLIDINECAEGRNNCNENATCMNTFGSFECTCKVGFTGDGVNCTSKIWADE